jgi:hypothetical protein
MAKPFAAGCFTNSRVCSANYYFFHRYKIEKL